MNILDKANKIINKRSEEKERQYGPFSEGMERATKIFNGMTGLDLGPEEMFKALVALKLSRESYTHKEDNLLDAIAYLGALNNYIDGKSNISKNK
jgi:DNA-binding protein H-NS